jgi:glycosyltransferase involved in cell wall biosynthesis
MSSDGDVTSASSSVGASRNDDVTVVVAAYDQAWCLEDCVNSVLDQSGSPRVVIVVDHCPNGTDDVARRLAEDHGQVTVVSHRENRGLPATRNTGLALVNTPWVLFLDGDDCLAPGALGTLRSMVDEDGVLVAMGRMKLIDRAGQDLVDEYTYITETFEHVVWRHGRARPAPLSLEALLTRYRLPILGSCLLSATRLREIGGFDEARRYWEDVEMVTRLLPTCSFAVTHERTTHYRVHEGQMSKRARAMYFDRISFSWSVLRRAAPGDRAAVTRGLRAWPRDHVRRSRQVERSAIRRMEFICAWGLLTVALWAVIVAEVPVALVRGREPAPHLDGESLECP